MNYFRKYKSHVIASFGSAFFCGMLILLLTIKPGGYIPFDTKMDSDPDLEVQLQLLEDMVAMQPTQTSTEEVKTEKSPTAAANVSENADDSPQNESVQTAPVNADSILMAEVQKSLLEFKDVEIVSQEDSIKKDEIKQNDIKKMQDDYAERARKYNENQKFILDNYRLINNVRAIYPYVVKLKQVVDNLNAQLSQITDNGEKRKLVKKMEKELFAQFEKDVRKMTYTQGKLMMKLISRETNETAYGLIKNYKGGLTATFWYGVGLIFQENLKSKYDSLGEDKKLESVVQKLKKGDF